MLVLLFEFCERLGIPPKGISVDIDASSFSLLISREILVKTWWLV